MNDRELKMLQHNLTRSAKKAKQYWVRGMVGFAESDQGFFPIGDIPMSNSYQKKETPLSEILLNDYKFTHELSIKHNSTASKLSELEVEHGHSVEKIIKLEEEIAKLHEEIKELATFNIG